VRLWEPVDAIAGAFADVESIAEECRFRDCRHASEPGCAVLAAVAAGMLPEARLRGIPDVAAREPGGAVLAAVAAGMLPEARLESFRKLQAEQQHQSRQQDERGRIETKR